MTVIECIDMNGHALQPLVIRPTRYGIGAWKAHATPDWMIESSPKGRLTKAIALRWLTEAFDPQTGSTANGRPRLLLCDLPAFQDFDIRQFCQDKAILLSSPTSQVAKKLRPAHVDYSKKVLQLQDEYTRFYAQCSVSGRRTFTKVYDQTRQLVFSPSAAHRDPSTDQGRDDAIDQMSAGLNIDRTSDKQPTNTTAILGYLNNMENTIRRTTFSSEDQIRIHQILAAINSFVDEAAVRA